MPITAFGLISNKSSLGNYNIKEHWKYYNKNCQFLLKLFGQYIGREFKHSISHTIIFEHKENAEYQKMKNLIYYAKYISEFEDTAKQAFKIYSSSNQLKYLKIK